KHYSLTTAIDVQHRAVMEQARGDEGRAQDAMAEARIADVAGAVADDGEVPTQAHQLAPGRAGGCAQHQVRGCGDAWGVVHAEVGAVERQQVHARAPAVLPVPGIAGAA